MAFFDIAYVAGLCIAAPYWLLAPKARRKVFKALHERVGREAARTEPNPAVMIHAVSLGEINATPAMVGLLSQARPDLRFIIATTTDTGTARAQQLYSTNPNVTLIRYPLDFSNAVRRTLDAQRPSVVVLIELEVWPNFILECERRGIPVVLVNGRLTPGSYRGYHRLRPFTAPMFRRLAGVMAQEQVYADRFIGLGVPPGRVKVTGTMKFDTAQVTDRIEDADEIAANVGLSPADQKIWVCGSTGPGEEAILLDVYQQLLTQFPALRLVIVPRKPERFDEVAQLISARFGLIRRSKARDAIACLNGMIAPDGTLLPKVSPTSASAMVASADPPPVILGDTMGELRKFYSLADVVFVGRTLVDLGSKQHGSDMIEPAALAKPVIVGPFTGNFAEVTNCFRKADALREVRDAAGLREAVAEMLTSPAAKEMGLRAQQVVRNEQGATARHVEMILAHLPKR
ncbi:MAG: waaA [Phycisphaerales bacterium]|jgi:3-deoxy-D-manno-octulosonic-acid transferase|nr:waaA [Phycisphaerales bacterium]